MPQVVERKCQLAAIFGRNFRCLHNSVNTCYFSVSVYGSRHKKNASTEHARAQKLIGCCYFRQIHTIAVELS